jgi:hypothetical protein
MVVKLRSAVGVGMIWLAAVAGVSVTAWVAIDRAGRDITDGLVNSLSPSTLGTSPVATTPGRTATPNGATAQPSVKPKVSPEPSRTPTGRIPVAQGPSSPALVAASGSTNPQDGTYSATGGQVTVRCTDKTIQLRIAQPDDGWRVEVGNAGPDEVQVIFRHGEDDGEGGTQVTALCAAGTPVFKVESQS